MTIFLILIFWLVCGYYGAGMLFSMMQYGFPGMAREQRRQDASFAIFIGLFGPIALVIGFFLSGFAEHGVWRYPEDK